MNNIICTQVYVYTHWLACGLMHKANNHTSNSSIQDTIYPNLLKCVCVYLHMTSLKDYLFILQPLLTYLMPI